MLSCCLASSESEGILVFLMIAGVLTLIFVACHVNKKRQNNGIAQGKALKRTFDFMEYAEIFTTRPFPFRMLSDQIRQIQIENLKIQMSVGQYGIQFYCKPLFLSGWQADINELETPGGRTDVSMFRFEFTHWTNKNGSAESAWMMNLFLTEIEKAILKCDWNAIVQSKKLSLTSKRKIW